MVEVHGFPCVEHDRALDAWLHTAHVFVKVQRATAETSWRIRDNNARECEGLVCCKVHFVRLEKLTNLDGLTGLSDAITHDAEVSAPRKMHAPYFAGLFCETCSASEDNAELFVRRAAGSIFDCDTRTTPRRALLHCLHCMASTKSQDFRCMAANWHIELCHTDFKSSIREVPHCCINGEDV